MISLLQKYLGKQGQQTTISNTERKMLFQEKTPIEAVHHTVILLLTQQYDVLHQLLGRTT